MHRENAASQAHPSLAKTALLQGEETYFARNLTAAKRMADNEHPTLDIFEHLQENISNLQGFLK